MKPAFKAHLDGWTKVAEDLNARGWEAKLTSPLVPILIEGVMPNGQSFAFYANHEEVIFSVGGPEPADIGNVEFAEECPGAGGISADVGSPILHRLYGEYLENSLAE